ncbi:MULTISPECIES: class I SAM-dependent methyltransferase [Aquimarina]|uniref:class I SAM-dependent methyltransferase n=1 Tax=Aquimarina TaxID=290174 RepID=UPI000CDE6CE7|nr:MULTISPECIES: class I SAM-dependent methyltransferase [Aquimarina]
MAEKFNSDTKLAPEELAKHLRQPDGETGKQIGLLMNKSNKHICLNSYKVLTPQKEDHILEIGMGNGFFVKDLLNMADNLTYTGVDFSATMVQEASLFNKKLIDNKSAFFKEASIENLPFDDHSFDSITTTNTLYFWPQPINNAKELLRVLKPNGKLLVAYRSKSCMDQLELAKHGFQKYESHDVEGLLSNAGFKNISTQIIKEPELEFDGKVFQIEGIFTTGIK